MLERFAFIESILHLQFESNQSGQSINQVLQAAFQILTYERVRGALSPAQQKLISYLDCAT
jgi:hypothetical protein